MIKKAIRKWLVPEYGNTLLRLESFLNEIEEAKKAVSAEGKDIEINGPVLFLGSLTACNIKLSPNIKPTIVLSKFDMDSMLSIRGDHALISCCNWSGLKESYAVYLNAPEGEGSEP